MPTSRVMDDDPIGALLSSLGDRKSLKLLKLGKVNTFLSNQAKPELITVDVINTFCRHLTDEHPEVRKEALDGLNSCLSLTMNAKDADSNSHQLGANSNSHQLGAMICVIITHLKCALTHLDQFIYKDSWRLLISLIEKLINPSTNETASIDQLGHLMVSVFGSRPHPIEHYESLALVIDQMFPCKKVESDSKEPLKLTWAPNSNHIPIYDYYKSHSSVGFCISFNSSDLPESMKESTKRILHETLNEDFKSLQKIITRGEPIKMDRKIKAISRIYHRINQGKISD